MQNFMETFDEMCEFVFLEGPVVSESVEAPMKFFVDRGVTPPYKGWLGYERKPGGDPLVEMSTWNKNTINFANAHTSIQFVTNFMNKQGPFDGTCGFSQGSYFLNCLYKAEQYNPTLTATPYFHIDFNGSKWETINFISNKNFMNGEFFIPIDSLNFNSPEDPI